MWRAGRPYVHETWPQTKLIRQLADTQHNGTRILLQVTEDLGVLPINAADRDVLEGLSNEDAITARRVVDAMKLSKQELEEHILPEVGMLEEGLSLLLKQPWVAFMSQSGLL